MASPGDTALSRIRLRHLQCFLAVAQAGNLRRAAEALAITQPAVTKTLNELEELLGVTLFERGRRGATLTAQAEVFLRHARQSVQALREAVESLEGAAGERPLRLGVLPTVAPALLPPVLQALRETHPQSRVQVVTARNAGLLRQLRQRELDAVIGRMAEPDEMPGLSFELLYVEPLVAVVRAHHALRTDAAAALGRGPLVLPLAGTLIRHAADGLLAAQAVAPAGGVVETLSVALARELVLAGDAVWITSAGAVEADIARGLIVRLPLAASPSQEPVGLLLAADAAPEPVLQALADHVRQQAARRRALLRD